MKKKFVNQGLDELGVSDQLNADLYVVIALKWLAGQAQTVALKAWIIWSQQPFSVWWSYVL